MAADCADITPNSEPNTDSNRALLEHILEDLHDVSRRLAKWEAVAGKYLDNPAARWARRNREGAKGG